MLAVLKPYNISSSKIQLVWTTILCLLIFPFYAFAVDINNENVNYSLTPTMSWYEDRNYSITIEKLIHNSQSQSFNPHRKTNFN
ncbi:MAG: hypothetical protein V3T17_01245, partial [Pseudomonadales bacterium]